MRSCGLFAPVDFANEVAIKADLGQDSTIRDVITAISDKVLRGMRNSATPFHHVADAIGTVRDSSRSAVFQAMFAYQDATWHALDDLAEDMADTGAKFTLNNLNHNTTKFEVHLQCRDMHDGSIEADFHYSTDLFELATAERFLYSFERLIYETTASPDVAVRRAPILKPEERVQHLTRGNDSQVPAPLSSRVDALFREVATEYADRVAIVVGGTAPLVQVTYRELLSKVDAFAANLKLIGMQPNDRVALLMANGANAVAAMLGTLAAGCVYVEIDPLKTPKQRIEYIVQDSAATTVIVDDRVECEYLRTGQELIVLHWSDMDDAASKATTDRNAQVDAPDSGADDVNDLLMAVYYTSGTTGNPKGVMTSHKNIINLIYWWKDFFELEGSDRVLLFSSLSFIMSTRQLYPTLFAGAAVAVSGLSAAFEQTIVETKVNKLVMTPSALATINFEAVSPHIKYIQVAGEAPDLRLAQKWAGAIERFYIGLGPTELTAHALCGQFLPDDSSVNIGFAAGNVHAYVADTVGVDMDVDIPHLQPFGVMGELLVAGNNVAMGYLNLPELTKKHFINNPYSADTPTLYRTGDLAIKLPNGRIQFVGRADGQIKINGFRIEVKEITSAMPATVKAAKVICNTINGEKVLVAYVTPNTEANSIANVEAALSATLPPYMVPKIIVPLEVMPLNKNGKVDVSALPKPKFAQNMGDITGPTNKLQQAILHVWSDVLHLPANEISSDAVFFKLGGTSLTAVTMVKKVGEAVGTNVSVNLIFTHQTVEKLALELMKTLGPEWGADAASEDGPATHSLSPAALMRAKGVEEYIKLSARADTKFGPWIFSTLQLIGIVLMAVILAAPMAAGVSLASLGFEEFGGVLGAVLIPAVLVGVGTSHLILIALVKWLVIGSFKAGKYPVYGWMFLRWWLMRRLLHAAELYLWMLDGTVWAVLWYRAVGAKVGWTTQLESVVMLEPDLIRIGKGCDIEYDVQLCPSEVKDGHLILRSIVIGDGCKIGARTAILGGAKVHDRCEVGPKSLLTASAHTMAADQIIAGSPGEIQDGQSNTRNFATPMTLGFQLLLLFVGMPFVLMTLSISFVPGLALLVYVNEELGVYFAVGYAAVFMLIIICITHILLVVVLKKILVGSVKPNVVYSGSFFKLRCWIVDRLLMGSLHHFACGIVLQTSSTFPAYWRLLGAQVGEKAWINHPFFRVGMDCVKVGSHCHFGRDGYVTTRETVEGGVMFKPIVLGDHSSVGQRVVLLGGTQIGNNVTVGADAVLHGDVVDDGGTAFGSPPMFFYSSASNEAIVAQVQDAAQDFLRHRRELASFSDSASSPNRLSVVAHKPTRRFSGLAAHRSSRQFSGLAARRPTRQFSGLAARRPTRQFSSMAARRPTRNSGWDLDMTTPKDDDEGEVGGTARPAPKPAGGGRAQDIGAGHFYTYAAVSLLLQGFFPIVVAGCYGGLYYGIHKGFVDAGADDDVLWLRILVFAFVYLLGTTLLLVLLKLLQLTGILQFKTGATAFFSIKFLAWHVFADLIYLCTSTVLYPLSGTQFYATWLRTMGAKIGKNAFVSPEGGGFRELDFLDVGDNAILLTPNIHAHYTDHGQLQFAPMIMEDNVVANFGATMQPLTKYGKNCNLRPFTTVVKGMQCLPYHTYVGNPSVTNTSGLGEQELVVGILFPGQGSQHVSMLQEIGEMEEFQNLFETAEMVLGYDVREICRDGPADKLNDTRFAQPAMFVAGIVAAKALTYGGLPGVSDDVAEHVVATAGLSLGELTALCFAGAIEFEAGLRLVAERAEVMGQVSSGTMCNAVGLFREQVEALCAQCEAMGAAHRPCAIANVLAESSEAAANNIYIVAGTEVAIAYVVDKIAHMGTGKSKKLQVSGAFHSKLMQPAVARWEAAVKKCRFGMPGIPVLSNVTGRPYTSVKEIKKNLVLHLTHNVLWSDSVKFMISDLGVNTLVECGPGKQLKAITRRIPGCTDAHAKMINVQV